MNIFDELLRMNKREGQVETGEQHRMFSAGPGHRLAEVERTAGQAITHHGFRRRISAPADDDAVITLLLQIGPVPPEYSSELVVYTIST